MSPRRDSLDWLLLATLVAMWGSSYYFIEVALGSITPLTLVAFRIVLCALLLAGAMRALALPLPRDAATWRFFIILALTGYCLPFFFITWGQQSVDSALAGILVGCMPLATLLLAHHFIPGEHVTPAKMAGFALGFLGLALLLGPEALEHWRGTGTELPGQLACLAGALCYAANSIVTKRMPVTHALVAAACTTTLAAAIMLPVAFALDDPLALHPEPGAIAAGLWLGVGPTAIATLVYFRLIARAGPSFMSLVNYLSPTVALGVGALLLDEPLRPAAVVALGSILGGIALATRWDARKRARA
ncbi:MAG: DMT family transporter [Burkholderiales bacterium]|nr:DMT family transporter [Burkholderiales bacterium]